MKRLRQTLRGIERLNGNPKNKKPGIGPSELMCIYFLGEVDLSKKNELYCWTGRLLAFGGCFRKTNITAKKPNCFSMSGVISKGSTVGFPGKEQMEVATSFSKTNQFSERQHKVFFQTARYSAFCAVTLTRKAMTLNRLPEGLESPLLCHNKVGGQQVALMHSVFDHWLRDTLKTAGMQPELYSGHSFRRGAATLAFAERMPRNLVKHWGDWVSDAVDEYHEMTMEQRLAIPRLVSESMAAAVEARH
ncbi:hypothetical protein CYMTET_56133 [Cymbomonas tetramitiformis]|uniref:Tyr recombinase domain-containing protein n=1 Tax=Cymbomonas tetramitiformis TaxID=36881 RepID=A0AAE0EP21_9CHLO|nr:hypothetical protein CYMTET_56133 [Cymbomonas tetramitiformis]